MGTLRRAQVHRLADVQGVLATLPTMPRTLEQAVLAPELGVSQLLARVQSSDEEVLVEVLAALSERGSADAISPLVRALGQRLPMSPRVAGIAERAVARIRERHGLAEAGALKFGDHDDAAGRIGISVDAGALSRSERDE